MQYEAQDLLDLYTLKVEEHWYTLFNPILAYLGDMQGKRVLDIGCGSGTFTQKLAEQAKEVWGIDSSKKWIAQCTKTYKKNNLHFVHANATNLAFCKDGFFDVVIMNMVVPNIYTQKDLKSVFSEIRRVTKKNAVIIFSDLHPLCVMTRQEGNRRQEYANNFSYFKEGARFSAVVTLPNKKEIAFADAHWTLGLYTNILAEQGMYIHTILESTYPKHAPKKFFRYSFPEYITLCCKKH